MPLKGWPSWGGHFNRPQLNHCRKPLTAPYSLSRTALLSGSQAVMQKDLQPGPLTTHPRPQGQPAPDCSQPPKRVLVLSQRLGTCFDLEKALLPPSRSQCPRRVWGLVRVSLPPVPGPWQPAPAPSGSRTEEMAEAFAAHTAHSGQGNPAPPPQAVPGSPLVTGCSP